MSVFWCGAEMFAVWPLLSDHFFFESKVPLMKIVSVTRVCLGLFGLLIFPAVQCLLFPSWSSAELVDRVVAVVNDDVITMSEVNEEGRAFFQKISEQVSGDELAAALRRAREEVLDGLIDKRLITQEAVKQKLEVSKDELDAALKQMSENNHMTPEQFKEQVRSMGMTEEVYRDNLRTQILQSKLMNYEVRSKVVISDDMVLDYYDTHYTKQVEKGGYYLQQMGFSWKKNGSDQDNVSKAAREETRKRAERAHELAVGGQDFGTLARKLSDLPSAKDGGNIGTFQKDDMADYMKKAVLSLKPGEVSALVETPDGFQFFKLLSSQEGGIVVQIPLESVKEEIKRILHEEKLKEAIGVWVEGLKKTAYIKKM